MSACVLGKSEQWPWKILQARIALGNSATMTSTMNRYWIPHTDIHRRIITQELQYHLGPKATVRPYTFQVQTAASPGHLRSSMLTERIQGEDGFLIVTPGACLTDVSTPYQRTRHLPGAFG